MVRLGKKENRARLMPASAPNAHFGGPITDGPAQYAAVMGTLKAPRTLAD